MRIRSIKPEFWRSDDITGLPLETRLTFIGLWSYVDDNGVGADKLISIVADLYADDFSRDPQETVKRVSEDLLRLARGGQVVRYTGLHNGSTKDLLYITKWKAHQKVNHPSLGHKYPLPPAEKVEAAVAQADSSGESLETLTHEQGNRGAGEVEQGSGGTGDEDPLPPEPPPGPYDDPPSEKVVVVKPPAHVDNPSKPVQRHPSSASKTLVWQELGKHDYPRSTVDQLAVQVDKLVRDEGHPDLLVREAVREWDRRPNCDKPAWLPTVYSDVVKKSRAAPQVSAADAKVNDWLALANQQPNPHLKAIGE